MNKVVNVNLGGNAYQLEEKAYEHLQTYLASARTKLKDDPDKDEVLADFERTIAEKCDGYLHARKTVIGETEIKQIIEEMGPVEAADETKEPKHEAEPEAQPKRLYTLREGAVVGGVANGLAAYFNIDVTIVRLIFVLLVFVSGGIWILIYLLAMLLIPEARTPEQKAELRGQRFSAQDVLDRAKKKYAEVSDREHWQEVADRTKPALSSAGQALRRAVKVLEVAVIVLLSIGIGLLTVLWISSLWWLAFAHPHFTDQLATISPWTVAIGLTGGYLLAMLPLLVAVYTLNRTRQARTAARPATRVLAGVLVLWLVSWGMLLGVVFTISGRIQDFQATHGYIFTDDSFFDDGRGICINEEICNQNHEMTPVIPPVPYHFNTRVQ